MKTSIQFATALMSLMVGLIGCGGQAADNTIKTGAANQPAPNKDPAPSFEIKRIASDRIQFESEQRVGNLDGRRLEVAPPKGWLVGSRQSGYLIWFCEQKRLQMPRVVVLTEDPAPGFETVTEENLVAFAKTIQKEIEDRGIKLIEREVLPMVVGGRACVRYVIGGNLGGATVDRQVLVTQVNGRRYKVELHAYQGRLKSLVDKGYSVMASMVVHDVKDDANNQPTNPPDNAVPAVEQPAAETPQAN